MPSDKAQGLIYDFGPFSLHLYWTKNYKLLQLIVISVIIYHF